MQIFEMKLSKFLIVKIIFIFISSQLIFSVSKVKAAEEIKIVYSLFSRTIKVSSLKSFAEGGNSTKKLKKILKATGSPDKEIRSVLNKKFEIPITSRRVLTMEWIDGTKLTNLEDVKKLGIDPDKMIDIGVQCSLEQLLEHGFFHADPHPGNLLALKDGRLCYLDFGMMSEVSRDSRSGLIQAVVHLSLIHI